MKELREKAGVLENFYNNLCITNVLSRDDVLSLEDSLGSNIITSSKDIRTFSVSKTFLNVSDVKTLLKQEIEKNRVASTITQEQLYDKALTVLSKISTGSPFADALSSRRYSDTKKQEVIDFFKSDKFFLRYELNGDVEELINIKDKGLFEVLISYPEVVDELAKLHTTPEKFLDKVAAIVETLNKAINNGENILEIDVNKLNFVTDNILSNFMSPENTTPMSWLQKHTTSYFMSINNFIILLNNIGYCEEKMELLRKFIYSISEYDNKRSQDDLDQLSDFLDNILGHLNNPHFKALYRFIMAIFIED